MISTTSASRSRQAKSPRLKVTRHPLLPGDAERQAKIFKRNAALVARFGSDRRGAYAAMASMTPMAEDVRLSRVQDSHASGWWIRPKDAPGDRAILFIHGGGYHLGDATSYLGFASQIAARTRSEVFSIDYPLAVEHRFPAAFEAAVAAREWLTQQPIAEISMVGDSAGGGLVLALLNVPSSSKRISSVVVFSPWTDLALKGDSFLDPRTPDPVFVPDVLTHLAHSYLHGADPRDWRASPLYRIPEVLPPVAIQVGTDELLLDDSLRYAQAAARRGGEVSLEIFEHMHHVFQREAHHLESADLALDSAAHFIKSHWANRRAQSR
jgi:monoterpene epsilon-lactone hydrolase